MSPDTRNKNIYGLGVGISTVFFFKYSAISRFCGVLFTSGAISNVLHILPVTQGTRMYYVLGVGISIGFKIFSNFQFLRGVVDPRGHIQCIAYIACNTTNKNIYGLEVGISIGLHENMLRFDFFNMLRVTLNFPI
jgi:hypothetical protein